MRLHLCWALFVALLCAACGDGPEDGRLSGRIEYELSTRLAQDQEAILLAALSDLTERMSDRGAVHMALTAWTSVPVLETFLDALRQKPNVRLHLVVDPDLWNRSTDPAIAAVRYALRIFAQETRQIVLENDLNPNAGRLGPGFDSDSLRQQNNFILFSEIRSRSDGMYRPGVVLLSEGFGPGFDGRAGLLLHVLGDPGLHAAYLEYWQAMAESDAGHAFRDLRTYSDQHDHRAFFFPAYAGQEPLIDLFQSLMAGLDAYGSPARLDWTERMGAGGLRRWRGYPDRLAAKHQAAINAHAHFEGPGLLEGLGMDSLPGFHSEPFLAMVVDGPVPLAEDALAERQFVAVFGNHETDLPWSSSSSNSMLMVYDRGLCDSLLSFFQKTNQVKDSEEQESPDTAVSISPLN